MTEDQTLTADVRKWLEELIANPPTIPEMPSTGRWRWSVVGGRSRYISIPDVFDLDDDEDQIIKITIC